jgi:hypothetical protein
MPKKLNYKIIWIAAFTFAGLMIAFTESVLVRIIL